MPVKSILSKLNFLLGRNPLIEKNGDLRKFIPNPYKAVVTITADFELAWAWRYSKSSENPHKLALEKAKEERENIPEILKLCDKYEIPITWATVGHLFLEKCQRVYERMGKRVNESMGEREYVETGERVNGRMGEREYVEKGEREYGSMGERVYGSMGEREEGIVHPEIPRLKHFENEFWKFEGKDWFEYDPCSDYLSAPEWYCPDLIQMILNSKVKHEIGCHTFSHIDCRDDVCPPEVFISEIEECKKEAGKLGLELKSFVHPGHTLGNLENLAKSGFSSFQTDPGNILGYPEKHQNGLWEMKRTYEITFRRNWSVDYHIYRYRKIVERAIDNFAVCNFWFHPSFDKIVVEKILPELFYFISSRKKEINISLVSDYVSHLEKR